MVLKYFSCPLLGDGTVDYDHAVPHSELDPEILEAGWLDWKGTAEMIGPDMYTDGLEVRFVLINEKDASMEKAA